MGNVVSRRTKIVCTLGPASDPEGRIAELVRAGMNVARLNFSHGDHQEHQRRYDAVRAAAKAAGKNIAILADLQGPKMRTGEIAESGLVELRPGAEFTITTREVPGDVHCVSTSYENLPNDLHPGDRVLLSDGTLELKVKHVSGQDVVCWVVRGGMLGENKGINLPGVKIKEPSLTAKDREDLAFAIKLGVDFVAQSFVREPADLELMRACIEEHGGDVGVVAKIERPEALENIHEIIRLSDVIMVARGDLGVEVNFEDVPMIQKRLIQECNEVGVPVITATQMLESMVNHPRPTRAEVADVANAIYDGTDAVMLSGETAAGLYPVEACEVMARIASTADDDLASAPLPERYARLRASDLSRRERRGVNDISRAQLYADAVGQAVCRMAASLPLHRIVCFTHTGYTATAIARFRPAIPITAISDNLATCRRTAMVWGVDAVKAPGFNDLDAMVSGVETILLDSGMSRIGDTVIIAAGSPLNAGGRTNLLELHTLGEEDQLAEGKV